MTTSSVAPPGTGDLVVEPVAEASADGPVARIRPDGGKHAFAHSLAVAALTDSAVLHDAPDHSDARALRQALALVFEEVVHDPLERTLTFRRPRPRSAEIVVPSELAGLSRSLFGLYPALLTRTRRLRVEAPPRGCALGERPSTWYLDVLRAFGVVVESDGSALLLSWPERRPARIDFDYPTMTGTVLAVAAAAASSGTSELHGTSYEPSCEEEVRCLVAMGGEVRREGQSLHLTPPPSFGHLEWDVAQDRIHAVTYLTAGLLVGRPVRIESRTDLGIPRWLAFLEQTGCRVEHDHQGITASLPEDGVLTPVDVRAGSEPHLSSDWLPFATLLLALCSEGTSTLLDDVFLERLQFVDRLEAHGLDNVRLDRSEVPGGRPALRAVVRGRPGLVLRGGPVRSVPDIRGSVAMTLALLRSDTSGVLLDDYHVRRGHTDLARDLRTLGLPVTRRATTSSAEDRGRPA